MVSYHTYDTVTTLTSQPYPQIRSILQATTPNRLQVVGMGMEERHHQQHDF